MHISSLMILYTFVQPFTLLKYLSSEGRILPVSSCFTVHASLRYNNTVTTAVFYSFVCLSVSPFMLMSRKIVQVHSCVRYTMQRPSTTRDLLLYEKGPAERCIKL